MTVAARNRASTAPEPERWDTIPDPAVLYVAKRLAWETRPVMVDATGFNPDNFWPLLSEMDRREHYMSADVAIAALDEWEGMQRG